VVSVQTISSGERVAGKPHQCFDCYRTIPKGGRHYFFTGKYDDVYTLRSHLDCREAVLDWISASYAPDYDDGIPPLRDMLCDSGEYGNWLGWSRGKFPHVVCRMELTDQLRANRP
jgi:hypothetical protein